MNAQGQHKRFAQLKDQDYRPEYQHLRTVASGSQDHAYLLGKVRCLSVPHKEADIVDDQMTVYLCSCDDHWYNRTKGFEEGNQSPEDIGDCKHISSEFAHLKAASDDKQTSL